MDDELKRLRAEVVRRQRAANNKVSRLRAKGVRVAGTEFDVRRPLSNVANYNRRQLNAYINKLNDFTARENAFVPGDSGQPIRRSTWQRYTAAEKTYNDIGNAHGQRIGNIPIKGAGMTINERDATLLPNRRAAAGLAVNRPYEPVSRIPQRIANEKSAQILARDMERRTTQKYLPAKLKQGRYQLYEMLTAMGDADLIAEAKKLSDNQFDILWNYTSFATDTSQRYANRQLQARGVNERAQASIDENSITEIRESIQWAGTLPRKK